MALVFGRLVVAEVVVDHGGREQRCRAESRLLPLALRQGQIDPAATLGKLALPVPKWPQRHDEP